MILALVSQKGGVGKSTLARLMGVEMARAGWHVLIADLDAAQGTSTLWKLRRDQENIAPDLDVQKFRSVDRALKEADRYDLLILDGPAHAERGGVTMAKAADLTILPVGYSLDDLEPQTNVAYELEEAGVAPERLRFAFSRARGSAKERQDAHTYVRRAGMTAFERELRELPTIRQAHASGRAASETTHTRINEESRATAKEIVELMLGQGART